MKIEQIIREKQGTIVDVRGVQEFAGGNAEGSINIPLNEIERRIDEIEKLKQPLVLCCASGGRSGMAHQMLSRKGIESYNAGSWLDVNYIQTQVTA